ncbi:hypothetical protein ABZ876_32400, partial [Streptomyces sp. NPDC046931]
MRVTRTMFASAAVAAAVALSAPAAHAYVRAGGDALTLTRDDHHGGQSHGGQGGGAQKWQGGGAQKWQG